MAMKRNICEEEEIDGDEKKMARFKEEDRVSKLPDDLKIHILSLLDIPDAIKTTMLSKTWVSFWTRIPLLKFNLFEYNISFYPKLKFFTCNHRSAKLDQLTFTYGSESRISHHNKGLIPVLDTMVISCDSCPPYTKKSFDNLISLFCTFDNVKYLTLFPSTVQLLSSFPEELVKQNSLLHNLKGVKLVFGYHHDCLFGYSKIVADVKAYLFQNSPHAKITTIYPN